MAESSSGEKTEKPTPRKLREARKKGNVPFSRDGTYAAVLITVFIYLGIFWKQIMARLANLLQSVPNLYALPDEEAFSVLIVECRNLLLLICAPLLIAVFIVGMISGLFQTNFVFSTEPLVPKFDKINPISKLKQIFSIKSFLELLKNIAKVTVIGIVIYYTIRSFLSPLFLIPQGDLKTLLLVLAKVGTRFAIMMALVYIVFAVIDRRIVVWQHIKKLMMTKDEVKRDHKQEEGDPLIKGKRREIHRELIDSNTLLSTAKSSVVVSNPTHRAVALLYKQGLTPLPLVVAKGKDRMALRMIATAKEHGVPVLRDVPLARALYETVEVNQYIPRPLLRAVAIVIRWAMDL